MAIITCPSCRERISSRSKQCKFCKTKIDDIVDDEKQIRALRNIRFKKLQRLQTLSFLAVLLFASGTITLYYGIVNDDPMLELGGRSLLGFGFVGYILTRVLLFVSKKK